MSRRILSFAIIILAITTAKTQTDHKEVSLIKSELNKNSVSKNEIYVTDHYKSKGITHTYYKEAIGGIPIFNSRGAIHYKTQQNVYSKNQFNNRIKSAKTIKPVISAIDAVESVGRKKGISISGDILVSEPANGKEQKQKLINSSISMRPIPVKLQYFITEASDLKLAWELSIESLENGWFKDYLVDAENGNILKEIDWTVQCNHGDTHDHSQELCSANSTHSNNIAKSAALVPNTYEVFAWPVESPNFGVRTIETSPWDDNLVASPNGWHTIGSNNFTTTRGNNTDTYLDDDDTNLPTGGDAARAEGGANLEFIFPLDVNDDPENYKEAAITNCFYWTNLMHDVWYNYGFDEASGNFQEENYTADGNGSDYVNSEVQDSSGLCNANFGTPPDGNNPRMQMFLCERNGEYRDGDYDNGVIAHEYGHGISNRLTGGPAASGCLNNQEQMGEGWSDFLGMVMTIEVGDLATDSRGMGTWLFGEGPNGDGIRPFPYSTDFNVNPMTYASSFQGVSVPHGVGSVWCTMLWDLTWALIDENGFDEDIYNGTGGNNIAMELVIEGMKLQPCSPGFVDGRNGILEADQLLNGGANECLIWEVFANRGLGYSADQGSSGSRSDGTEAFDLAPSCSLNIGKSTVSTEVNEGGEITYILNVENNYRSVNLQNLQVTDTIPDELEFVSASDGGMISGNVISWPLINLNFGDSKVYEAILKVKTGLSYDISDFVDDIENGANKWDVSQTGSTNWSIQNTASNSGTNAWFAPDNNTPGTAFLDLAVEIGLGDQSDLSFFHSYNTEATWDGGQVFISTNGGSEFLDLGAFMITNGYNSTVFNSIPGFSGNSNGFINTRIDLSSFAGQHAIIRFQMNCDQSVGGVGWWIDDVIATDLSILTVNQGVVENDTDKRIDNANGVKLNPPSSEFSARLITVDEQCGGLSDGSLTVIAQGGTSNCSYLWNDGNTDAVRNNIASGVYIVTITDNGQEIVRAGIVNSATSIMVESEVVDVDNVTGDNGSITLEVSGGEPEYSYAWSNGSTMPSEVNLAEGVYGVTVTDLNGCMEVVSITVDRITCGDSAFDSGGQSSNYSNFDDITTTYCPDSPDKALTITFNSFNVEPQYDALYIHNGDSTNEPLFESGNPSTMAGFPANGYYGTTAPGPFTSTDDSGCITFRFRADGGLTEFGWDVSMTCEFDCSNEVVNELNDGVGSLRRTILCADAGDVIPISSSLNLEQISLNSKITIDKAISLDMPIGNSYSISINGSNPIFEITTTGSLSLNNVTLNSSLALLGGAIINDGSLTLDSVDVFANENVLNQGALILNNGQLTIKNSVNIKKE